MKRNAVRQTGTTARTRQSRDPIHQLEADLKHVGSDPVRFPRTSKLRAAGAPQQAKKIVEEATELAIEAMLQNKDAAVLEAADLLYNMIVLLEGMDIRFDDVTQELERRRTVFGIAAKQHKNGSSPTEPADA